MRELASRLSNHVDETIQSRPQTRSSKAEADGSMSITTVESAGRFSSKGLPPPPALGAEAEAAGVDISSVAEEKAAPRGGSSAKSVGRSYVLTCFSPDGSPLQGWFGIG